MSIQDLETQLNLLAAGRDIATLLTQFNREAREGDPAVGEAMVVIGEYLRANGPGARNEVNTLLLNEGLRNGFGRAQLMEAATEYAVSDERTMRELVARNELLAATLATTQAALAAEQAEGVRLAGELAVSEAAVVAVTGERDVALGQVAAVTGERDAALANARGLSEALERSQEGRAVADARLALVEGNLASALGDNASLAGTVAAYEEARHMLRMAANRDITLAPEEAPVVVEAGVSSEELRIALAEAQLAARQERATMLLPDAEALMAAGAAGPAPDVAAEAGVSQADLRNALAEAQLAARQERATMLLPDAEALMAAGAAEPAPDAPVAHVSTSGTLAPVVANLIDLAAIDARVGGMALGSEARERVARAQAVLEVLGGDVAVDGLMGPQSRAGIGALDEARIAALSVDDRQAVREVLGGVRDIAFTRGANRDVPGLVDQVVGAIDAAAPAPEPVAQAAIAHDPDAPAPEGAQAGLPVVAAAAAGVARTS